MNIFTTYKTELTPLLQADASEKKLKKMPPHEKNSIATAHCTHLPLPAIAQIQPEGKVKRVQSPKL